ncbi:hypothetical protein [Embleya sp. AB8]|uniref:hypothetical protein n=1 Tax=Embleya sp. AB8 TaxID=3156304 RepID=UPI003C7937A7
MTDRPTLKTTLRGEPIELPGTLADIRAALPEDQRAAFDDEINNVSILSLPTTAAQWAMPPEMRDEIEADAARIRAGDFTGLVNPDGTPFTP